MQYLAEELMLLALDDDKGRVLRSASSALSYGLIGAVLMELLLQRKLDTEARKMIVVNTFSTGDDFLDELLNEMATTQRLRSIGYWIGYFRNKHRELKKAVLRNLVEQGILTYQEQRELWIFPLQRYPLANRGAKQAIVDRVRGTVLEGRMPDSRTTALISLLKACNLTNTLFTLEEWQAARQQIEAIAKGELVGKAVFDVVASAKTAIVAGIVAANSSTSS